MCRSGATEIHTEPFEVVEENRNKNFQLLQNVMMCEPFLPAFPIRSFIIIIFSEWMPKRRALSNGTVHLSKWNSLTCSFDSIDGGRNNDTKQKNNIQHQLRHIKNDILFQIENGSCAWCSLLSCSFISICFYSFIFHLLLGDTYRWHFRFSTVSGIRHVSACWLDSQHQTHIKRRKEKRANAQRIDNFTTSTVFLVNNFRSIGYGSSSNSTTYIYILLRCTRHRPHWLCRHQTHSSLSLSLSRLHACIAYI